MTHVQMDQLVEGADINSRQGADRKEGIVELAASIKAHGLILPLAVRRIAENIGEASDDVFEIVDGHRRFAALKKLKWSEPVPVNVIVGDGRAQSLAANIERLPLHPVDQYDALARLTDEGWSSDRIMKAFNLTSLQVRRVLALAKMSAKVRTAWKKGEIKQDTAQLFTLTTDVKLQDAVLKKALEQRGMHGGMQGYEIRQLLTAGARPIGKAVDFVGIDRVTAAGIQITEDLFAERDDQRFMVSQPDELAKLVDAKVLELAAQYGALGFNIITDYDEALEYEELEEPKAWDGKQDIAEYLAAIPADKRDLTWLLDFGHAGLRLDGPMLVTEVNTEDDDEYGADEDDATDPAMSPEQLAEREARQQKIQELNEAARIKAAEHREALGLEQMTAALAQDVRQWRATAFRAAYKGQGKAFLKVMLHNAHARYFNGVHLGQVFGDGVEVKDYASVTVMADQIAQAYHGAIDASSDDAAQVLADLLADPRRLRPLLWDAFKPHVEDFFKRSKKDAILEALDEMNATPLSGTAKKDELSAYAVKKATDAEWLPKLMRIGLNATQSGVSKKAAPKPSKPVEKIIEADDDFDPDADDADLEARDAAIAEAAYDHADLA